MWDNLPEIVVSRLIAMHWELQFTEESAPIIALDSAAYTDEDLEWVPYEEYMEACLKYAKPGEPSVLIIRFPANGSESSELHSHDYSDRVITVLEGDGFFIYRPEGESEIKKMALSAGKNVFIPRGKVHTFIAGSEGLLVASLHYPFIPLENERCLTVA